MAAGKKGPIKTRLMIFAFHYYAKWEKVAHVDIYVGMNRTISSPLSKKWRVLLFGHVYECTESIKEGAQTLSNLRKSANLPRGSSIV